jgi:hypothetical protein
VAIHPYKFFTFADAWYVPAEDQRLNLIAEISSCWQGALSAGPSRESANMKLAHIKPVALLISRGIAVTALLLLMCFGLYYLYLSL